MTSPVHAKRVDGGSGGNITLEAASGFSDGTISIGRACSVRVSGTLSSRNSSLDSGTNLLEYYGSLDASGASVSADDDGGNLITCRCVDANLDGAGSGCSVDHCDGAGHCIHPPPTAVPTCTASLAPTPTNTSTPTTTATPTTVLKPLELCVPSRLNP